MKSLVGWLSSYWRAGAAILAVTLFGVMVQGAEPSPSEVAEMLVGRYSTAIVRVGMVVKVNGSVGGKAIPARELKHEAWATMINPDGLAVVSLAAIDPGEVVDGMRINTAKGPMKIEMTEAEFKLVRLHLTGGEVPARVVLKDTDLDIAFIKPITPLATKVACVDLANEAKPRLLATGYILGRSSTATQGTPMVRRSDIISLSEKPRRRIVPEVGQASCPMFAADGKIYGLCVRQFANGRPAGSTVLSAADIAEIAKQADVIIPQPEDVPEAQPAETPASKPAAGTDPTPGT